MKIPSFIRKSLYSALVFFGTLLVLSVGYSTWNAAMERASSGSTLNSGSWNTLVDNISDLDSRWGRNGLAIVYTGGNVGIGTASPRSALDIGEGLGVVRVNSYLALWRGPYSEANIWFNLVPDNTWNYSPVWAGAWYGGWSLIRMPSGWEGGIVFHTVNFWTDSSTRTLAQIPERMRIASNGNVGIGTTSPWTKLEVVWRIRTTGNIYWTSCTGWAEWEYNCSPMMCFNMCKAAGDRMASRDEVYASALRWQDFCTQGWHYSVSSVDNLVHYAVWYPMWSSNVSGCWGGVANTPRFVSPGYLDTTDLNSNNRAWCFCSGL